MIIYQITNINQLELRKCGQVMNLKNWWKFLQQKKMVSPFTMAKTTKLALIQSTLPEIKESLVLQQHSIAYVSSEFRSRGAVVSFRTKNTNQEARAIMEERIRLLQQNGSFLPVNTPFRCTLDQFTGISDRGVRKKILKLYHPINENEDVWNYEMTPYVVGLWLLGGNREGTSVTVKEQIPAGIMQEFLEDIGIVADFTRIGNDYIFTMTGDNNLSQQLTALGLNNGIQLTSTILSSSFQSIMDILAAIVDSYAYVRKESGNYVYRLAITQRVIDIVVPLIQLLGIDCNNPSPYYPTGSNVNPRFDFNILGTAINEIPIENLSRLNHDAMEPEGSMRLTPEYKTFTFRNINEKEIVYGFRLEDDSFAMLSSFTLCSSY